MCGAKEALGEEYEGTEPGVPGLNEKFCRLLCSADGDAWDAVARVGVPGVLK